MDARPAVAVHNLAHARAALSAARAAGTAVTLLSAEGAAAYAGPAWFAEVIRAAREAVPEAKSDAYLDCADRPGDALAAFRARVPGVIFTGRPDVAGKLAALAGQHGIPFRTDRPAALDLLDHPHPEGALAAHLAGG